MFVLHSLSCARTGLMSLGANHNVAYVLISFSQPELLLKDVLVKKPVRCEVYAMLHRLHSRLTRFHPIDIVLGCWYNPSDYVFCPCSATTYPTEPSKIHHYGLRLTGSTRVTSTLSDLQ